MTRVRGGWNQYGFTIGILMLDTRFPRIPGDMGNAATFPFPVRYHRIAGADPDLVVRRGAEGLLPAFVEGARTLDGSLYVEVADPRGDNPELVRALVTAGARIVGVVEEAATLEQVYLDLVGETGQRDARIDEEAA